MKFSNKKFRPLPKFHQVKIQVFQGDELRIDNKININDAHDLSIEIDDLCQAGEITRLSITGCPGDSFKYVDGLLSIKDIRKDIVIEIQCGGEKKQSEIDDQEPPEQTSPDVQGPRVRRGKKSKLDPHRREIEHLLAQGTPKIHIAQKYGVSGPSLHQWIKSRGIETRKIKRKKTKNLSKPEKKLSQPDTPKKLRHSKIDVFKDQIIQLLEAGQSVKSISRELKVSEGGLRNWIKTRGLEEKLPARRFNKVLRHSKLDPHRGEIIKLLAKGTSRKEISEKYGVSYSNLILWIKSRKIKGGMVKGKLDSKRRQIERLLRESSTLQDIAKIVGTTPPTLSRWLKKNGLR